MAGHRQARTTENPNSHREGDDQCIRGSLLFRYECLSLFDLVGNELRHVCLTSLTFSLHIKVYGFTQLQTIPLRISVKLYTNESLKLNSEPEFAIVALPLLSRYSCPARPVVAVLFFLMKIPVILLE